MVLCSALKFFAVGYGLLVTFGQYTYAEALPAFLVNPCRLLPKMF
jgi:hypothetical protein